MFHIAAGVCLGILASHFALVWLNQFAEWRAKRRQRRAERKAELAWEARKKELLQTNRPRPSPEMYAPAVDRVGNIMLLGYGGVALLLWLIFC